MDSKDQYICGSVMTYTFVKNNGHHVNMPQSWILVVCGHLVKKSPPLCASLHNISYEFLSRILCEINHILNEIAQFTDYITFIAYKTCFSV